ncbi:MAG: hypothetical protein ABEJ72_09170 [Candidatus Aenigmatarchaeota archaeon]
MPFKVHDSSTENQGAFRYLDIEVWEGEYPFYGFKEYFEITKIGGSAATNKAQYKAVNRSDEFYDNKDRDASAGVRAPEDHVFELLYEEASDAENIADTILEELKG